MEGRDALDAEELARENESPANIPFTNSTVLPPDPHGFDGDVDGIGCES